MGRITSSPGGVALSDVLAEWNAGIVRSSEFITDPDGYRLKVARLATLAHRQRQVSDEELNEMLELTDAARLWALTELEEADAIGLFAGGAYIEEGMQVLKGVG